VEAQPVVREKKGKEKKPTEMNITRLVYSDLASGSRAQQQGCGLLGRPEASFWKRRSNSLKIKRATRDGLPKDVGHHMEKSMGMGKNR